MGGTSTVNNDRECETQEGTIVDSPLPHLVSDTLLPLEQMVESVRSGQMPLARRYVYNSSYETVEATARFHGIGLRLLNGMNGRRNETGRRRLGVSEKQWQQQLTDTSFAILGSCRRGY